MDNLHLHTDLHAQLPATHGLLSFKYGGYAILAIVNLD